MDIPSYLLNEHFDDRYFDVVNALDEAQQIYFDNNHILERMARKSVEDEPFFVGETGFGADSNPFIIDETGFHANNEPFIIGETGFGADSNPFIIGETGFGADSNPFIIDETGFHANNEPFIIGETGFGAGRNLVALLEYLKNHNIENIDLIYQSVELFPMSAQRMGDILLTFGDRVAIERDTVLLAYAEMDIEKKGWHCADIVQPFGKIRLRLYIGEALEMVNALENPCDVWFLDGHGPKKNPEIWRPALLSAIGQKTKAGGTCSTFTVAGSVKDALRAAGFTLTKMPGCGGKNSVLYGVKSADALFP